MHLFPQTRSSQFHFVFGVYSLVLLPPTLLAQPGNRDKSLGTTVKKSASLIPQRSGYYDHHEDWEDTGSMEEESFSSSIMNRWVTDVQGESSSSKKVVNRVKRATPPEVKDILATACNKSLPKEVPLKCYQCKSSTKLDKEPMCDNRLWKYLRHSERARMRIACDFGSGKFCAKIVRERLGERVTERGCFGDTMPGPNATIVQTGNGCVSFGKGGFYTGACFCNSNFCNGGSTLMSRMDPFATLCMLMATYGIIFIYVLIVTQA